MRLGAPGIVTGLIQLVAPSPKPSSHLTTFSALLNPNTSLGFSGTSSTGPLRVPQITIGTTGSIIDGFGNGIEMSTWSLECSIPNYSFCSSVISFYMFHCKLNSHEIANVEEHTILIIMVN